MNKERRRRIDEALTQLRVLHGEIEAIRDEEQEAFDNLSEGLQQSERGQAIEEAAGQLDEAAEGMQATIDALESV